MERPSKGFWVIPGSVPGALPGSPERNLVPRVLSLSNTAAVGAKTLAHSELKRSLIGAFHGASKQRWWARSIQPKFPEIRSKTQCIGSVQPEKFRINGSTFLGGPLFPVGPVGFLVEWIAPGSSSSSSWKLKSAFSVSET